MHGHEIHPISKISVWSNALMCIGIHDTKHERICQLFVFMRRRSAKLMSVSSEVNVSLHYARKSHERHITSAISDKARIDLTIHQITGVSAMLPNVLPRSVLF